MAKIFGHESVVVTKVPQEQSSERKGERIGVIELPKISYQESVEVVKIIPQERNSERMYERSEVGDVPKISEQERSRLEKLGVFFRMWTWASERAAVARLRRKCEGQRRSLKPQFCVTR